MEDLYNFIKKQSGKKYFLKIFLINYSILTIAYIVNVHLYNKAKLDSMFDKNIFINFGNMIKINHATAYVILYSLFLMIMMLPIYMYFTTEKVEKLINYIMPDKQ